MAKASQILRPISTTLKWHACFDTPLFTTLCTEIAYHLSHTHLGVGHFSPRVASIDLLKDLGVISAFIAMCFVPWTACHLGGFRKWFLCPISSCRRRNAKVYLHRAHIVCRHCHSLAYFSQNLSIRDHALDQTGKLRLALGGHATIAYDLPSRPPRMRLTRYG